MMRLSLFALLLADFAAIPAAGEMPASGDYLSDAYVAFLKESHSPLAALKRNFSPQIISVENGRIVEHINWHEGCTIHPAQECPDAKSLNSNDKDEVTLKGVTYRLTSDPDTVIGAIVLGGEYVDERGKLYRFDDRGTATFPDRSFRYELCLEQVGPPCGGADMFYDKGTGALYAFKRDAGSLLIFAGPADESGEVDFTKPLLRLKAK